VSHTTHHYTGITTFKIMHPVWTQQMLAGRHYYCFDFFFFFLQ